jgi:hypothetical protein
LGPPGRGTKEVEKSPRLTPSVAGFLLPVTSTWASFLCLLQAFKL